MGLTHYLKRILNGFALRQADNVPLPRFTPSPVVRKHLAFQGHVQGVGFRFEAMQLAGRLGLTGWIKNRADGSVEAEVQGEEGRISFLIDYMKSIKRISIESVAMDELPLIPNEPDFDVKWE